MPPSAAQTVAERRTHPDGRGVALSAPSAFAALAHLLARRVSLPLRIATGGAANGPTRHLRSGSGACRRSPPLAHKGVAGQARGPTRSIAAPAATAAQRAEEMVRGGGSLGDSAERIWRGLGVRSIRVEVSIARGGWGGAERAAPPRIAQPNRAVERLCITEHAWAAHAGSASSAACASCTRLTSAL